MKFFIRFISFRFIDFRLILWWWLPILLFVSFLPCWNDPVYLQATSPLKICPDCVKELRGEPFADHENTATTTTASTTCQSNRVIE